MLTNLLVICLLGLTMIFGWVHWKHRRFINAANQMKSVLPIRFHILGHMPYTFFGLEGITNRALKLIPESLKEGLNMHCLWIGPYPIPLIGGVEDVQKILNSSCTSEKGDEMRFFDCVFGKGLLNSPGSIWKIKRRYINPLFHPHNLQHMMPSFNRNSEELVTNLSKHVGQSQFDIMDPITDTALKTICHLIFGPDIEFDMKSQGFKGLRRMVEWIPETFIKRLIYVWLRVDAIFNFLYNKELVEINKFWNQFTEIPLKVAKQKLEEKLKRCAKEGTDDNNIPIENNTELLNLIDVHSVLEEKFPQFTEADLKFEMATLYATGTDTIAGAVSSCLLLLANHKDVQERLYNEIKQVSPDGEVTLTDIQNLPYLDQVYKETLRWSIIVPFVIRKTSDDLKLGTVTIPAGYTIAVSLGTSMLDSKVFPDPTTFDPERFSTNNVAERKRYSFMPFSGGSRNCIGQIYTNMLMKVMLVHILRKYKLSTTMDVYNLRKKLVVTLISLDGYKVTLENR